MDSIEAFNRSLFLSIYAGAAPSAGLLDLAKFLAKDTLYLLPLLPVISAAMIVVRAARCKQSLLPVGKQGRPSGLARTVAFTPFYAKSGGTA